MRKSVLLALLALFVAIVAACGGQSAQTPAPAPTTAPAPKPAATEAPKAAAPTTAPAAPTTAPAAPTAAPKAAATDAPKAAPTTAPAAPAAPKVEVGKGGVLRYNVGTYPDNLDPHQASFTNEIIHLRRLYEGLTTLDKDLKVAPGAAASWTTSADGLTWTFKLRPNLKWSDGSPLTAKDFEWSIKRAASPQVAGEYQAETFLIEGAEAYATSDAKASAADQQKLMDAIQVKATDDSTLTIKTVKAAAYFPYSLTLWVFWPLKKDVIEKGGETWFTTAANHVGNGPFKLQTLTEKQVGVLVPNTNYHTPVALERLEFRYITDANVAFEAYKNNELDVINLGAEQLNAATRDTNLAKEIVRYPGACTIGMLFNQARPPFNNKDARVAFGKALDRTKYVTDVLRGIGAPTTTWIPKGIAGNDPTAGGELAYDAAAAKAAWAKAGYTGEVKITYAGTPTNKIRFEFIASQIQASLGITPVLDPVEPTTMTALQKDKNTFPLITVGGWCSDYPDPQNWMSVYWDSKGFAERYSYKNDKVDELQRQADVEKDPAKRIATYQEAQKLMLGDVGMAPLYHTENVFLVKPFIKGYAQTAQDHFPGEFNISAVTALK